MSQSSIALDWNSPGSSWRAALIFAGAGVSAIALLFYGHWSVLIFSAVAIFVLSAMENQAALLISIFLLPAAWVIKGDDLVSNVIVPARDISLLAFFLG